MQALPFRTRAGPPNGHVAQSLLAYLRRSECGCSTGGRDRSGVLSAELNVALRQWSILNPPAPDEYGLARPSHDEVDVFRLALDTIITGLESGSQTGTASWAPAIEFAVLTALRSKFGRRPRIAARQVQRPGRPGQPVLRARCPTRSKGAARAEPSPPTAPPPHHDGGLRFWHFSRAGRPMCTGRPGAISIWSGVDRASARQLLSYARPVTSPLLNSPLRAQIPQRDGSVVKALDSKAVAPGFAGSSPIEQGRAGPR